MPGSSKSQHFAKAWMEQCAAAAGIRERFGLDQALEYFIGEKFINFLKAADRIEV